jgi:hypothetical protein
MSDAWISTMAIAFWASLLILAWRLGRTRWWKRTDAVLTRAALTAVRWGLAILLMAAAGAVLEAFVPHWLLGAAFALGAAWVCWQASTALTKRSED